MALLEGVRDSLDMVGTLKREEEIVSRDIREGRFQRSMALITAFAAIVSGWEAYSQHLRGAFSHWLMWTPVLLAFPAVAASVALLAGAGMARTLLLGVSLLALLDGVVGFGFHVRGIARLPGGFKSGQYNVVMGPPIFAPLLLCTVGILGFLAALLRPEQFGTRPSLPNFLAGLVPHSDNRPRGIHLWRGLPGGLPRIVTDVGHGRFQEGMALTSALFSLLAGGEVYFEHLRGSFNQWLMWLPVWATPPMIAAGLGAMRSSRLARWVLPLTSLANFLVGLLGFGLHLRGIRRMPGGFTNLQFNATLGPPLFAPLLFTSVGLLGFIATLLRRREG